MHDEAPSCYIRHKHLRQQICWPLRHSKAVCSCPRVFNFPDRQPTSDSVATFGTIPQRPQSAIMTTPHLPRPGGAPALALKGSGLGTAPAGRLAGPYLRMLPSSRW
jgi:hypothetical protein